MPFLDEASYTSDSPLGTTLTSACGFRYRCDTLEIMSMYGEAKSTTTIISQVRGEHLFRRDFVVEPGCVEMILSFVIGVTS